jgi:hypothetical protein
VSSAAAPPNFSLLAGTTSGKQPVKANRLRLTGTSEQGDRKFALLIGSERVDVLEQLVVLDLPLRGLGL